MNPQNFISLKFLLSSQNTASSLDCVVARFVDIVKQLRLTDLLLTEPE